MLLDPAPATQSITPDKRPNHKTSYRVRIAVLFAVLTGVFTLAQTDEDRFGQQRDEMVRTQIAASRWGGAEAVRDARIIEAFRETPRHRFAPAALSSHAYEDRPLPIGYGQTISQPYVVAKMTELLEPKKNYRALEIGTGSGYQAAILSRLVAEVYTIEIVEPLGVAARKRLADLGYRNVEARIEDGYFGWPEKAPFDCIVVTAAASHIPPALIEQLKPGGRMVIPVGNPFQTQRLVLVSKGTKGPRDIRVQDIMPVMFVPLVGGPSRK
jgi:protein-L-isoaspartate(D-aspartate) O-methyltransferase